MNVKTKRKGRELSSGWPPVFDFGSSKNNAQKYSVVTDFGHVEHFHSHQEHFFFRPMPFLRPIRSTRLLFIQEMQSKYGIYCPTVDFLNILDLVYTESVLRVFPCFTPGGYPNVASVPLQLHKVRSTLSPVMHNLDGKTRIKSPAAGSSVCFYKFPADPLLLSLGPTAAQELPPSVLPFALGKMLSALTFEASDLLINSDAKIFHFKNEKNNDPKSAKSFFFFFLKTGNKNLLPVICRKSPNAKALQEFQSVFQTTK